MTIHTSRFNGLGDTGNNGVDDTLAPVVALDREAARAAISAAAGRFTALLQETGDIGRPAAGFDWTVAETAAHVSCMFTGFSAAIAGEPQALTPGSTWMRTSRPGWRPPTPPPTPWSTTPTRDGSRS